MKRLVIKIGTNILTTPDRKLDLNNLRNLVCQIGYLVRDKRCECIIVTSGSITCGSEVLALKPETIPQKQASASVGQFLLMREYATFFSQFGIQVGQILLTRDAIDHDSRRHNIENTIQTLLGLGIVPIINENDSVSTDEIQFGDNDNLSSRVAVLANADLLIILTDTEGLFTKNPKIDPQATLIEQVSVIDDSVISLTDSATSDRSKGGMLTKVLAAKYATEHGIETRVAYGRKSDVILDILDGKTVGTQFLAKET